MPITNGTLSCHSTVIKHMVSSVSEAEIGAVFVNAKESTVTHKNLAEMGHPQEATELKTEKLHCRYVPSTHMTNTLQ
jgi:hypothetical protein